MDSKRAKKIGLWRNIEKFIYKFFDFVKELTRILCIFIENTFRLAVHLFGLIIRLLSDPSTPCVVAIFCFGVVVAVAAYQWWGIGVWVGNLLGINSLVGIESGLLGVLLGSGLNIYQLAPQMWKISKKVAEGYKSLKIDTEYQAGDPGVDERLGNWTSEGHRNLKMARLATYSIETGLVVVYVFLGTKLNFFSILIAAISLILPEKCLELVSSTVGVLGTISDKMAQAETDHATF